MRVALAETHGIPPRLTSMPMPEIGAGQALVRVQASGVNPLDLKILAGSAAHARHPLPAILGMDLAGVVVSVAPDVDNIRIGDEVFGLTGGVGGQQGSLAEYAAVDASLLAIRPPQLAARAAAALPLAVITAWEGLVDRAHLHSGQVVLIHGGGGGVGHAAVQIAIAHGATVFATGSEDNQNYIEQLGAGFIDYHREPVEDYVNRCTHGQGFDLVYDTAGGSTLDASFSAVRRHGHVVSCLGWGTHSLGPLSFKGGSYSGVFTLLPLLTGIGRRHHGEILEQAARLAGEGKLVPRVDPRHFSLDSVAEAYAAMTDRPSRGKIVVDVSE
jgi:NADPH2:quinone reductase